MNFSVENLPASILVEVPMCVLNKPLGIESNAAISRVERHCMNTTPILAMTALTLLSSAVVPSRAGDREWAVAGKVLTGVVAAGVLAEAFRPAPVAPTTAVVYQAPPQVVYAPPPPTVVYVPAPPPPPPPAPTVVYYAAPPVAVYTSPVVVAPSVYYHPAPICYGPAVRVSVGFGGHGGYRGYHRGWR